MYHAIIFFFYAMILFSVAFFVIKFMWTGHNGRAWNELG